MFLPFHLAIWKLFISTIHIPAGTGSSSFHHRLFFFFIIIWQYDISVSFAITKLKDA